MPRLSDSMEEGTIVSWLVAEGEEIGEGQPIAEIETDKATVTFEAMSGGVILALSVSAGTTVAVGAPIAVIGQAGEASPGVSPEPKSAEAPPASPESRSAEAPPAPFEHRGVEAPGPTAVGDVSVRTREPRRRTKASPLARRIAAQRGIDLTGLAGSGPEGRVIRADVERMVADNGTHSVK